MIGDAMSVKCPMCKANPGSPCVYMSDKVLRTYDWATGVATKTTTHERGTPTVAPHTLRRQRAGKAAKSAQREAYWATMIKPPASLFSLRAFDVAEYEKTKAWLRAHGHILWQVHPTYYDRWQA